MDGGQFVAVKTHWQLMATYQQNYSGKNLNDTRHQPIETSKVHIIKTASTHGSK